MHCWDAALKRRSPPIDPGNTFVTGNAADNAVEERMRLDAVPQGLKPCSLVEDSIAAL
jgi:hypothetical protein